MDDSLNISQTKKVEGLCGRCVGRSNNNANANGGLVYSNANNASSNSNANNGSRLNLGNTSDEVSPSDVNRHTSNHHEMMDSRRRGTGATATADGEICLESGNITNVPEGAMSDIPFIDSSFDEYAIQTEQIYPVDNLIPEIISEKNLSDSFDYVISHLEHKRQREHYWPKKERYIRSLRRMIKSGTYRLRREAVREIVVRDGPKDRIVQVTTVFDRFACHCIMVIVEKYCYPTLIKNAAASVKGRGMHWLHCIIHEDIKNVPDLCKYYCQTDINKFYDNIDQEIMKSDIRMYICDEKLLPILDDFITLLPSGLSKGLRSSQVFANLYMSPIDWKMILICERYVLEKQDGELELRFLYARYMDDAYWWSDDKKLLWMMFNVYQSECAKRKLSIKPSYAVRPLSEGFDALGYKDFGTHVRIRKRIKQNFARKMSRVKSRKRRQELIGSFKGMAKYSDSQHLYRKLTGQTMKKFSDFEAQGVKYTPTDGKKRFKGDRVTLGDLVNTTIIVHDFERDCKTPFGDGRYIVSCSYEGSDKMMKFFTNSEEMKSILNQIEELDGFPFQTTIKQQTSNGIRIYSFK